MRLLLTILFLLCAGPAWSDIYYVTSNLSGNMYHDSSPIASSCSDVTNADTNATDLDTILGLAGAGGTLYVCPGSYVDTDLDSDNYIQSKAANQTLEAVGTVVFTSSSTSGIKITHDGFTIKGITLDSNDDHGIYNEFASGLTVDSCIVTSNGKSGFKVISRNNETAVTGVVIKDSTFSDNTAEGVWFNWGDDDGGEDGAMNNIEVDNCTISGNTYGTRFTTEDTNEYISDVYVHDCDIYSNSTVGIYYRYMDNATATNVIEDNKVHENSASSTLGGIWIGETSYINVLGNEVYSNHTNGIDGVGIFFDNGTNNYLCDGNLIYDHDDNTTEPVWSAGIALLGDTGANTDGVVRNNILLDNYIGIDVSGELLESAVLYNNTIVNSDKRGIWIGRTTSQAPSNEVTIKNNLIADTGSIASDYGIYDNDGVNDPVEDYNAFFGLTDNDYQFTATNSVTSDPLFTNASGNDFTLTASSPAIDAGVCLSDDSIDDDYDGDYRPCNGLFDIGAYEYSTGQTCSGGCWYFVSEDGDGDYTGTSVANAGSNAALSAGNVGYVAGDTIYMLGTIDTLINMPSGGSAGSIVYLRGDYPGNPAVLEDRNTLGSWTDTETNDEFSIETAGDHFWPYGPAKILFKDGVPVDQTSAAVGSLEKGRWKWVDDDPDVVYYRLTDAEKSSPGDMSGSTWMTSGGRAIHLDYDVDYVTIQGFTINYAERGITGLGDGATHSNNILISGNTFNYCFQGIYFVGCNDVVISDNTFSYGAGTSVKLGQNTPTEDETDCATVEVSNNIFEYIGDWAWPSAEGEVISAAEYSSDITVSDNTFRENGRFGGYTGADYDWAWNIGGLGIENFTITRNFFYNTYGGCISTGSGGTDNTISTGHLITNNIFSRNGRATVTSGEGYKTTVLGLSSTVSVDMNDSIIAHNTFSGNMGTDDTAQDYPNCIYISANGAGVEITDLAVLNNVFDNNTNDFDFKMYSPAAGARVIANVDSNFYYRQAGSNVTSVTDGGINSDTWVGWVGSNYDLCGSNGNSPKLLRSTITQPWQAKPRGGSVLINAGTNIDANRLYNVITNDYSGRLRKIGKSTDIGAWEWYLMDSLR